MDFVVRKFYK